MYSTIPLTAGQVQIVISEEDLRKVFQTELTKVANEFYKSGTEEGRMLEAMKQEIRNERPLTIAEAAEALGVCESTIRNWTSQGRLETMDYGDCIRIERSEIERFKRVHTYQVTTKTILTAKVNQYERNHTANDRVAQLQGSKRVKSRV